MTPRTSKNIGPWLAFTAAWFERWQWLLLALLNEPLLGRWFRWVLRIRKHDVGYRARIVRLLPHAYVIERRVPVPQRVLFAGFRPRTVTEEHVEYVADFRSHPKYAKRLYHAFKPLWWAIHAWDWAIADRWLPAYSFGFATLTAYPDPGDPGTTTVDGRLSVFADPSVSWGTLRGTASATSLGVSTTSDIAMGFVASGRFTASVSNQWEELRRSVFTFDTSAIGGGIITAATLSLATVTKVDDLGVSPNADIYTVATGSANSLAASDFSAFGSTSQTGSALAYASISGTDGTYNDFAFNATGLGNITGSGVSKFGCRNANFDAANSAPTWTSAQQSYWSIYLADQTGSSNDPKLVVTYTPLSPVTLYLASSGTAAASPTINSGGEWEHANTARFPMSATLGSTALGNTAYTPDGSDHLVNGDSVVAQFVSTEQLAAQTIVAQTVKLQVQGLEAHTNNNLFLTWKLFVVSSDGSTVRGTLLAIRRDGTELATSLTNRSDSATTSSLAVSAGDRLVLEIGGGGTPAAAGGVQGHNLTLRFGESATSGDLPEDDSQTGTTYRPWLQFATGFTWAGANTDIPPGAGTLSLAGAVPRLAVAVAVGAGALSLAGQAPTVAVSQTKDIPAAAVSLSGAAPTVSLQERRDPAAGALALGGATPSVGTRIATPAGALALSGAAPVVSVATTRDPAAGTLAVTGLTPSVATRVAVPTGSLAVTGAAPALAATAGVAPSAGALALAGAQPSLATTVAVAPATLSVSGLAPGVGTRVAVPAGSLAVAGSAPALASSTGVAPGAGAVVLSGLAPSLATVVAVPVGTVSIGGLEPAVVESSNALAVSAGALALTGLAPTVGLGLRGQLTGWALQMELAGPGNGWTDVSADVRTGAVTVQYGIDGNEPSDRVASAGSLQFALNNAAHNSGGVVGYYSPLHASKRSGFDYNIGVRWRLDYFGVSYYKFRGKLADILPTPGLYGPRLTRCTALDWMDDAARMPVPDLGAQTAVRADEIVTDILAALTTQPAAQSIETGIESFAWALDGGTGQQQTVREELQKLCLSEFGYAYVKGDTTQGGTFQFEARRHRSLNPTTYLTFADDMARDGLVVVGGRDDVYRRVQVVVHPTRVDAAATTVLFSLQTTSTEVRPGETLDTIFGPYRDPDTNDACGGTAMVTPVATTDYTMNSAQDGSGTDLTANFSVTASYTGQGVRYMIVNNGATAGFITKLQARGKGVYRTTALIERTVSGSYGDRVLTLDLPYQSNVNTGTDIANYLATLLSSPSARVQSVKFLANRSDAFMTAALEREPGDRIAITETVTGLDGALFTINSVRLELLPGGILWCTWGLEPALVSQNWLLGTAGASELGSTTVLGF